MLIIIPAHFLGSVVGIVAFKALLPFIPAMVSTNVLVVIWSFYCILNLSISISYIWSVGIPSSSIQHSNEQLRFVSGGIRSVLLCPDCPRTAWAHRGEQAQPQIPLNFNASNYVFTTQWQLVHNQSICYICAVVCQSCLFQRQRSVQLVFSLWST